jgi:hypothetical protein
METYNYIYIYTSVGIMCMLRRYCSTDQTNSHSTAANASRGNLNICLISDDPSALR